MALSGDEIRRRLGELASRWGGYRDGVSGRLGDRARARQALLNRRVAAGEVEYAPFG